MARLDARLLQALVDSDTGAQDGCNRSEIALLGNAGNVGSLCNGVLLEGTVDGVSGEKRLGAQRLVGCLAEVAGQAGTVQPFDTSMVTNLDIGDEVTNSYNYTGTFVATDEGELGSLDGS